MKKITFASIFLVGCAAGPIPTKSASTSIGHTCTISEKAPRAHRELLGTWRLELIRVIEGNRLSTQQISGETIVHYYCNGTWDASGPNYRYSGTYAWVSDDTTEQRVVDSNHAFLIGQVTRTKTIVDEHNLEMQIEQPPEERAKLAPIPKPDVLQDVKTTVIAQYERVKR